MSKLRELRLSYSLGLNKAAKMMKIHPSYLSLVERYKRRGSLAFYAKIQRFYSLSDEQVNALVVDGDNGIRRSNVWHTC